jgi:hypothetical protein
VGGPLTSSFALLALFFVSSLSLVPLFTSPLRADDVDPSAVREEAAESRSATFEAVTGAQQEDVPGGPLLVAAYGAVLVLVLGYVLYLGGLTAGASRDLERLERAVRARTPTTSGRAELVSLEKANNERRSQRADANELEISGSSADRGADA